MSRINRLIRCSLLLVAVFLCLISFTACGKEESHDQTEAEIVALPPEETEPPAVIVPEKVPVPETPAPTSEPEACMLEELRAIIQPKLDARAELWDVWIEDLASGDSIHCTANLRDDSAMVSASLVKLFIMGTVYDRIENGVIDEQSVWKSLYAMITISDNYSANELISLLGSGSTDAGRQAVNDWAASVGCGDVRLNRLMLEPSSLENYVSAESCARLLRQIYNRECVSRYASTQMLSLLLQQTVNDRIPAGIPGADVAHKTGNLYNRCVADAGIVFDKSDYIICAICNYPANDSDANDFIVSISADTAGFMASAGR